MRVRAPVIRRFMTARPPPGGSTTLTLPLSTMRLRHPLWSIRFRVVRRAKRSAPRVDASVTAQKIRGATAVIDGDPFELQLKTPTSDGHVRSVKQNAEARCGDVHYVRNHDVRVWVEMRGSHNDNWHGFK